jgi:DNA processing protein
MTLAESIFSKPPISPLREMGAYEALWSRQSATFKTIADCFRENIDSMPSDLVSEEEIESTLTRILEKIEKAKVRNYGVRIYGSQDYPDKLRDAVHPIEFLYYCGWWDLIESKKSVAVVGSRNPSNEGIRRAQKMVKLLVENSYTIVSGLAKGIDTVAHKTAIACRGNTVAVIGTPITEYYPPENKALQDLIANKYLLISQVPIWRYSQQNYKYNRLFFPERNATMSALTQATIIIEASETSGTLTQARAALKQGRKLFILDSCFRNPNLTWPERFQKQGAIRVTDFDDVINALE